MIQTYGELKQSVIRWIDRKDLASVIDDICMLGIRRVYRDVRCPANERLAGYTQPSTGWLKTLPLPGDFLELRMLTCNGEPLRRVTDQQAHRMLRQGTTGKPQCFGRIGVELALLPIPDGPYDFGIWYWTDESELLTGRDEAETQLLQSAGELFLYACLTESEAYLINDPRVATWEAKYEQSMNRLNRQAERDELSGGPVCVGASN